VHYFVKAWFKKGQSDLTGEESHRVMLSAAKHLPARRERCFAALSMTRWDHCFIRLIGEGNLNRCFAALNMTRLDLAVAAHLSRSFEPCLIFISPSLRGLWTSYISIYWWRRKFSLCLNTFSKRSAFSSACSSSTSKSASGRSQIPITQTDFVQSSGSVASPNTRPS